MQLTSLDAKTTQAIYKEHLVFDFPKAEVKPFWAIRSMMNKGFYHVRGLYDSDVLKAYILFVLSDTNKALFIDYFAVTKECRGSGIGTLALTLLCKEFSSYGVFLEIEDPDSAATPEHKTTMLRRQSFYERAGFHTTDVRANVFAVDYRLMTTACYYKDAEKCRKVFHDFYLKMMPAYIAKKNIIFY